MKQIELSLPIKENKSQPKPIFSDVEPVKMRRITWRQIPLCQWSGFYRGRITWANDNLIQVIITHTPNGYDLGWHRYVAPAEVVCIKRK